MKSVIGYKRIKRLLEGFNFKKRQFATEMNDVLRGAVCSQLDAFSSAVVVPEALLAGRPIIARASTGRCY